MSRVRTAREEAHALFDRLGLLDQLRAHEAPEPDGGAAADPAGGVRVCARSPITGELMATLQGPDAEEADRLIERAHRAFLEWRAVPAPRRGELVRLFGGELRRAKADLGLLVTLEAGKILSEGLGEVQEMIDICDFAVGLSRQLHGLTIATERADHRMMETWHPLGVVGIVSAFNFPVAVFCWNAALALSCGDAVVWKPSEKTPLTALAVRGLFLRAAEAFGAAPADLVTLLQGDAEIGRRLVDHPRVSLVSATGSTAMGRQVAPRVAARFGRALLELGGNNAAIVAASADLDLALRGAAFSAMGTAGQRCTTLRRLFVHESVYTAFVPRLIAAFASPRIGDPRSPETLIGPLIDGRAFERMQAALQLARAEGGRVSGGGAAPDCVGLGGVYARPAIVEMGRQSEGMRQETFAPILYVMAYRDLEEAIALQNDVPQGLSSSIFTNDLREAELFLSSRGSDCGLANVNLGPSGAEIGGAFGGEKETGGGRESGSDAWRAYMRRATNTINYGRDLPLAQGVRFDL